jgi:hypothetical protein
MKTGLRRLGLLVFGVALGLPVGWWLPRPASERVDRVVAMSWGDGSYGKAFYGAHVYLEQGEDESRVSVRGRVYIGRGDGRVSYFRELGELGTASTEDEAVARWGAISWREEGLAIGTGPDARFVLRETLERHR